MKKLFCLCIAIAMMLTATAALADTVVIGGIAPLTGPAAIYGLAVRNGVDLFVKEYNAAGGLNGNEIKIEWMDDKHDSLEAANAYNRLLDMKDIVAIIGPVTSGPTRAIRDDAMADGIPLVTGTATSDEITEVVSDNIFRICFKDSFQGKVMATFAAQSLGAKKVALLYDNSSDYSTGIAEEFRATLADYGVEIVADEACVAGVSDFKAQLTNIAAAAPDAVFAPMYYEEISLIVQQAREVGIEAPFMGVDGWDGIQGVLSDMSYVEGYYFCNHTAVDDDNYPGVRELREVFQATYNESPNTFAALGTDAIAVLIDALERAESLEWADINAALRATSYEGITGTIAFDEYGDVVGKPGVINQIVEGSFKFYELVTP